MTSNSTVAVQSAIVHITDRNAPAPVCSDIALNLTANPVLREYFTGQIQNAVDDEDTNPAKFATTGSQAAKNACNAILAGPSSFVTASQDLARLLYAAMQTHGRIAPGSLAVCTYTKGDAGATHLALMKLDPGSALVQKIESVKGKTLVTFDVQGDVMPSAREKIHKAALLPPPGTKRYELLLLDHQTPPLALWWTEAFLNASVIVDGKRGADLFIGANARASRELAKQGKLTAAHAVMEQSRAAVRNPRVVLSEYRLSLPEEAREVVGAKLEKVLEGARSVPINVSYAASTLTNKTRYRGGYGFLLEFDSDRKDIVKENTTWTNEAGVQMTRFVLEVPDVKWVK